MSNINNIKPGEACQLVPGSVIVVGPGGEFTFGKRPTGETFMVAIACDFLGPSAASKAQTALVNERWALWDDLGEKRVKRDPK
jgi:hypothetical protein